MKKFLDILCAVVALVAPMTSSTLSARNLTSAERREIADVLTRIVGREILGGAVKIDRLNASGDRLEIYASIGLSYYPFREDNVRAMYDSVRSALPAEYAKYKLSLITDNRRIEELIPHYYRTSSREGVRFTNQSKYPLVRRISSQNAPSEGLAGRHIAMWQSHGRYFDQKQNIWRWQRSR